MAVNLALFSSGSAYGQRPVGGAEHALKLLAELLAARGHRVTYLTRQPGHLARRRQESREGVSVVYLPRVRLPALAGRWTSWVNRRLDLRALARVLRSRWLRDLDLVHTYSEVPDTWNVLRARRMIGASFRVVIRVAGIYWHQISRDDPAIKRKVEWVYNGVDGCNFISAGLKEMFERLVEEHDYRMKPGNPLVLEIGADPRIFHAQWRLNPGLDIVMVARFARLAKRHDLLIKAIEGPGLDRVRLHLVGEGPTRRRWMTYCAQRPQLRDRVAFHGYRRQDELAALMSGANLLCLATDYEGLSKSVIEAMSLGLPVCVSDVPALNTYVRDGSNGFLVRNTVDGWRQKLREIVRNRDRLTAISRNQLAFVRSEFDAAKNIERYEAWLEAL